MKLARACTVISLVLFPFTVSAAPEAGLANAQRTLETARANLTAAVQKIEKDPPSNADLDAAHAAVEALKSAIEAGAEQEQNDLDYAKAVLAARKELRTQRQYVDQRRANVHIFDARRLLDLALPKLAERSKRIEDKDASPKDFEDARAAVAEVRKVVDGARAFGKEDPKFAAYLTETDANLTRREKAIDDRTTALAVGKQRPLLEEKRKALAGSLAVLGKDATDAQFSDADRAAADLSKRLEEGKDLEAKDATYRADAARARSELAQAKKKMDELFSSTGLARLKAEIEPARKDLAAAARGVRARRPTPEQLAEARTAAIVVRKLIEKFQPEAARSQAFGQYVGEVQNLLAEVEGVLQLRNLDAATADVNQALKNVAKPAPTDEAFAEANSALGVLEKTLATVDPKNPALTQAAGDARALLRDARSSTSRRRVAVDVERLRPPLSASLAALSTSATDAQFEEARRAMAALTKRLDDEKELEAKDAAYRAEAAPVRSELAQAKKKVDELWSATGLARLKAEIEPARKDLGAAARNVRARRPTPEQLAEARTTAIVVRKLIEKFQPEATRIEAFGKYVADVQNLVVEVEVELQKRNLEAASAEVNQALKNIAKPNPADDVFEEANSALGVLEKTLATVDAKNPALAAHATDAKALLREGRAGTNKRRIEVDVERQRARVEVEREKVAALMEVLSKPGFSRAQWEAAESGVKQLATALEAGTALSAKDRGYAAYEREVKARITALTTKLAARKVTLAAGDARALLIEKVAAAKAALELARQPESTDAQLTAASQSVEAINQAVEAQVALEPQDYGYYAQANKTRDEFFKLMEAFERARQVREVRKRTVELLSAGTAAVSSAAAANLRTQKTQYEKAISQFKACATDGASMLKETPTLEKAAVVVDGRPTTPKDAVAACAQQATATELLLKQVVPLLAFEEGPKRAYELAKGLAAKGSKTEAIAQFDECIATGIILRQRSPELKERKFTVAGAETTLGDLITLCTTQSKALRGK